jgi:hypothetical protein
MTTTYLISEAVIFSEAKHLSRLLRTVDAADDQRFFASLRMTSVRRSQRVLLSTAVASGLLICGGAVFAQTTPCPTAPPDQAPTQQSPQPHTTTSNAPAQNQPNQTQPAKTKTTQPKTHQSSNQHGQGHGHGGGASVSAGVNVDLSGIGQRRPEADPFAIPAQPQPATAHTEQKSKTTNKSGESKKSDPFANVQLTGPQAKAESDTRK